MYKNVCIIQRNGGVFIWRQKFCDYNKKKSLYFFYVSNRVDINASWMLIDSD